MRSGKFNYALEECHSVYTPIWGFHLLLSQVIATDIFRAHKTMTNDYWGKCKSILLEIISDGELMYVVVFPYRLKTYLLQILYQI